MEEGYTVLNASLPNYIELYEIEFFIYITSFVVQDVTFNNNVFKNCIRQIHYSLIGSWRREKINKTIKLSIDEEICYLSPPIINNYTNFKNLTREQCYEMFNENIVRKELQDLKYILKRKIRDKFKSDKDKWVVMSPPFYQPPLSKLL